MNTLSLNANFFRSRIKRSAELQEEIQVFRSIFKRAFVCCSLVVAACALPQEQPVTTTDSEGGDVSDLIAEPIFNANNALFEAWQLVPIRGTGSWTLHYDDSTIETPTIRGVPDRSASAIMISTLFDPLSCPVIEWRWMVESAQRSADLSKRSSDDVAASLMVLFGDPGTLLDPQPVPTLRYAWTGAAHPVGSIIENPYQPSFVKNIVVQNADGKLKTWISQRRDLLSDYERAFGSPPSEYVWAIALFIDNDQTGEEAAAQFAKANIFCEDF